MTETTTPRAAGDYVFVFATDASTCCQCRKSALDGNVAYGQPLLGLLDRGPLCDQCREREPLWVQTMGELVEAIDGVALMCPAELRDGVQMSILNLLGPLFDRRRGFDEAMQQAVETVRTEVGG